MFGINILFHKIRSYINCECRLELSQIGVKFTYHRCTPIPEGKTVTLRFIVTGVITFVFYTFN